MSTTHRRIPLASLALAALAAIAVMPLTAAAQALAVSEHGLGGIGIKTRFEKKALQAALPGYRVKSETQSNEGGEYKVFLIADQSSTLAIVNPDESARGIFSIRVVNKAVANALGPRIGDSYAKVYGAAAGKGCVAGEEEMSGKVVCPHAVGSKVVYVFHDALGSYKGPDGTLPSKPQLAKFAIEEIVWRP